MAKFLTTQGTSYYLEQIILSAKDRLVLISPYLRISKTFLERLKDANARGVKISIVYGKKELHGDEEKKIFSLKNLTLFYFENLHAKCYANERNAIVTSMNMYEFSEKNNREMGVLIDFHSDPTMYHDVIREVRSIIDSSQEKHQEGDVHLSRKTEPHHAQNSRVNYGTCIRCYDSIEFDLDKPMCYPCFVSWDQFANWDYPENHCHLCAKPTRTSMSKPLCDRCYSQMF